MLTSGTSSFSKCLRDNLPSQTIHDHANYHGNDLSKTLPAISARGRKEILDGRLRLKLSLYGRQRGSVVANLRFDHASLAVFIIEEVEYRVERLLGIIHHVSERASLTVVKKIVTGNANYCHFGAPSS